MEGVEHETVEVQEQPKSASKEEEEEAVQEEEEEEEDGAGSVSVFVKGLSFDTTEEVGCGGSVRPISLHRVVPLDTPGALQETGRLHQVQYFSQDYA